MISGCLFIHNVTEMLLYFEQDIMHLIFYYQIVEYVQSIPDKSITEPRKSSRRRKGKNYCYV